MTCDVLVLPFLPCRSPGMWRPYRVGTGRHRRRSWLVGLLLLPAGSWRRSAGRMIGGIAAMAARADTHYYQQCHDADCMQFGCRAYKTGWQDGYEEGYEKGYADGYAAGYGAGYQAGYSAGAATAGGKT